MVTAIIELEKVDDVAVRQAIVQISQRPAQDKAERDLQQTIPNRTSNAVNHHHHGRDRREQRQQERLGGRTHRREDPEGYPCISYIRNVKKAVYYGDRVVQLEPGLNQGLGPAVEEKGGDHEKNIWKPRLEF